MATLGADPLLFAWMGTSPHSTLSQTGNGALQFPLGRQEISGVPIKAFPLVQENNTLVPIMVSNVLAESPRRTWISLQ